MKIKSPGLVSSTVIIACLAFLCHGCCGYAAPRSDVHRRNNCTGVVKEIKPWTVLVYLNADNDLGVFINNRVQKIKTAVSGESLNILIQFDGQSLNDSKRIYLRGSSDPKASGNIVCMENIEYDMLDPQTLADFTAWGIENFPSRRIAVIMASHGMGILNLPKNGSRRISPPGRAQHSSVVSFSYDGYWQYMDQEKMVSELGGVLKKYNRGEKIDIFAFDSCLMGNFETLTTLSPVANYAIASEYLITYSNAFQQNKTYGLPVDSFIDQLSRYPDDNIRKTGRRIVTRFRDNYEGFGIHHSGSGKTYYPESSLALYDLSHAEAARDYLTSMVKEFTAMAVYRPALFEALFRELLKAHLLYDPVGYIDLAHFAEIIHRISGLESAEKLVSFLNNRNKFIHAKTIIHTLSQSPPSGISIFFPNYIVSGKEGFIGKLYSFYKELEITRDTGLNNLLGKYLNAVEQKRAQMLTRIIEEHIHYNQKFRFEPSQGIYDELYLFTITEIALYPLLDKKKYHAVRKYLEMIAASAYKSLYLDMHRKDMRRYLERIKSKEVDTVNRVEITQLIDLFENVVLTNN